MTISIIPGEAPEKAPRVSGVETEPRAGGGTRVGKVMGAFGVLGDLAMGWDITPQVA
ncbi:hypothetical protein ACF06D_19020 [Streptomyces griseoluteus]|uniref:hypothetical protein n=1 Tax=Streptomyces griseoluteus TaxID=29306 RepID=UPI0036F9F92D